MPAAFSAMRSSRVLALVRQLGGSPAVTDALQQPAWISATLGLAVKPFSSGPGSLQRPCWHSQQAVGDRQSAAAASSAAVGALLPAAAAAQQPCRGYAAASKGSSAALRRLKRASARVATGVGSRHAAGREAALAREEAGGGEVEAGPAHDVVVHEGPANSVQIASVVDHPALIVTRPIEWCAGVWLACRSGAEVLLRRRHACLKSRMPLICDPLVPLPGCSLMQGHGAAGLRAGQQVPGLRPARQVPLVAAATCVHCRVAAAVCFSSLLLLPQYAFTAALLPQYASVLFGCCRNMRSLPRGCGRRFSLWLPAAVPTRWGSLSPSFDGSTHQVSTCLQAT